jgi:hypothetical protein
LVIVADLRWQAAADGNVIKHGGIKNLTHKR